MDSSPKVVVSDLRFGWRTGSWKWLEVVKLVVQSVHLTVHPFVAFPNDV